ncbi:hypothetical protein [Methyloversatilis sp.]|uniref:hypothetical protein n=1 Tax=Methyloversatilis sp. TaxID=2569862 RepID=UPI003F702BD7
MKPYIRHAIAASLCAAAALPLNAAEPLHPLSNPSLYEQQGYVNSIDTATGAMTIGGKRYKGNANTVIFLIDKQGRLTKGRSLADIPANTPVSFATGADGTVTQVMVGNGITQPAP